MKILAFYLPQYHRTKENDEWWGEGFTEWTSMKNARPLNENHYQPRIPLNKNYYDLTDPKTMAWQIDLAKKYGVYGFCVYHYWFEGKQLLQKPMEIFLEHKELDFPICFCWANETWTNAWATNAKEPKVLMLQTYGDQDAWEKHLQYLLPFFKDPRYIKIDNKPLFVIYRPEQIEPLNDMLDYFVRRLKEEGFDGAVFASQQRNFHFEKCDDSRFDYKIEYQPSFGLYDRESRMRKLINKTKENILLFAQNKLNCSIRRVRNLILEDYDGVWEAILNRKPDDEKMIPGAFVDWDNTPRYGKKGMIIQGATPEKFKTYLKRQIVHAKNDYHKDMIFLFAWNEWAEGGYLEPDEKWKTGYLEAIKDALVETGEWENQ
jgi:hypothetical protein